MTFAKCSAKAIYIGQVETTTAKGLAKQRRKVRKEGMEAGKAVCEGQANFPTDHTPSTMLSSQNG